MNKLLKLEEWTKVQKQSTNFVILILYLPVKIAWNRGIKITNFALFAALKQTDFSHIAALNF